MLGDEELDKFRSITHNFKTLLSDSKSPGFSFVQNPDINSEKTDLASVLNPDMSQMDTDALLNSTIGAFASSFSSIRGSGGIKIDNSNVEGDGSSGDVISDLIKLILGIIQLPIRFAYMAKSLAEATGALTLGIDGLVKSVALGTKDIYLLVIAVLQIIFSNLACLIRFILFTVFGGCIIIHVITLFFIILYLFIMFILDKIKETTGIDLSTPVDSAVDSILSIGFIKFFRVYCYSCNGRTPMKLDSILTDVGVIQDIGNMISYDFNNTMPGYMRSSIPLGTASLNSLDKAIN